MAREKNSEKGQYGDVVARLTEIVQALEAGELSLEESLERFAEGVQLVKTGEGLLSEAEKRIEQLLSDDGKTAPLKVPEVKEPPASPTSPKGAKRLAPTPPPKSDEDLDDVPF